MGRLDRIWKQQRLRPQKKFRIYSALVTSVLIYRSETLTLRKADSDKLQTFHIIVQRRLLGIKWYNHITNKLVQERSHLADIRRVIADRRHSLFGHICRLPPDKPAGQALQLLIDPSNGIKPAPDWKRPGGRPRRTWVQQLEEDTGMSTGATFVTTQDVSSWRSLRPSAGQMEQSE